MVGQVFTRVIGVHKRALDARDTLKDVLQALAEIMAIAEAHALVEDDVDFDVEFVAGVVGSDALDAFDGAGEAHGEVEEDVALVL